MTKSKGCEYCTNPLYCGTKCKNCGLFATDPDSCKWTQVDDEHMPDTWQADCGAMWTFTDGGPQDNGMNFCPNCGKPLIEKQDE